MLRLFGPVLLHISCLFNKYFDKFSTEDKQARLWPDANEIISLVAYDDLMDFLLACSIHFCAFSMNYTEWTYENGRSPPGTLTSLYSQLSMLGLSKIVNNS